MRAERIVAPLRGGSSLPVLAETSSGARCVIKWKGTGEGPLANAVDWIALHLARIAGIRVPGPHLIQITPDLAQPSMDPDITDLIGRSIGLNLGIEFIEGAVPYRPEFGASLPRATRERLYLFDTLFLNIDRTDLNPNMVIAAEELYCLDFAAAMAIKMLMDGQDISEQALLTVIRRHPFYTRRDDLAMAPPVIPPESVEEIVGSMPDEWLGNAGAIKKDLIDGINGILGSALSILEHRVALLDHTPLEGAEEMKARMRRNRQEFERKWLK